MLTTRLTLKQSIWAIVCGALMLCLSPYLFGMGYVLACFMRASLLLIYGAGLGICIMSWWVARGAREEPQQLVGWTFFGASVWTLLVLCAGSVALLLNSSPGKCNFF